MQPESYAQTKGNPSDAERLWAMFTQTPSMELRNEIVMHYIYLVKTIVARMVPTYRKHVDFDDLMSCGVLGLMDAVDKFDIAKEVKFETYASLRIKGEIIDQIRRQDWAPISLRQKIKKVEEAYDVLESQTGYAPNEKEVAGYLQMHEDEVKKVLDESHTFNLMALDEMLIDRLGSESLASDENNPAASAEDQDVRRLLAQFIDTLPENEKLVISMYYYDELTLREIGSVLGVSESRVSQIHSKAMMTLRTKMKRAFNE